MSELHVLRVFTTSAGDHGNALGVFPYGAEIQEALRQGVASDLGFAETVFVDDLERAEIRIFAPDLEMPFAGHPCVGTAWLLRELRGEVAVLRPPAGEVRVRYESELVWVAARAEWSPQFEYVEFDSVAEVDALTGPPRGLGMAYCWAWDGSGAGRIRARAFVPEAGIAEDEATGSAALALCARLGRPVQIRQGRGSEILARPIDEGYVEVGGRVISEGVNDYAADSR